jgi:hypothetical protein
MSIPPVRLTSSVVRSIAEQAKTTPESSFRFRGAQYPCRELPINLSRFTALGYHPHRFQAGALIGLMSREHFQAFTRACGTDAEGGLYPLSANGDNQAVLTGELAYLPVASRNIILPFDFSQVSLAHELAHDICIGRGITADNRSAFFRGVLHWYRNSHDSNFPHLQPDRSFYAKVASLTGCGFNLAAISKQYCGPDHSLEPAFRIFAGECFAYACEAVLNPSKEMASLLPKQVFNALRSLRIFQPLVIQEFLRVVHRF